MFRKHSIHIGCFLNSQICYIIVKVWEWVLVDWEILVAVISALAAVLSAFYAYKANKKADTANKLSEEANTIAKRSEYSVFYYHIDEIQKGISNIDLSFNSNNLSEAIQRNGVLIDELEKIIQKKSSIKIPDDYYDLFNETFKTLQSIQTELVKINSNEAPRMILHRYDGNHLYEDVELIKHEISKRISRLMTTYINIKGK